MPAINPALAQQKAYLPHLSAASDVIVRYKKFNLEESI